MVAAPPARTAALAAARARDSQDKRHRALAAVQALEAAGKPVTFPAVARAARVSSWLVYAHGVREHVEAARHRQATTSAVVADTPRPAGRPLAAPPGLRADLALAREEIKRLRTERDTLLRRVRLQLGAEIDGPQRAELIGRVADLEAVNRQLVAERDARAVEVDIARRRVRDLEDELSASRESLRRMIRSQSQGL